VDAADVGRVGGDERAPRRRVGQRRDVIVLADHRQRGEVIEITHIAGLEAEITPAATVVLAVRTDIPQLPAQG
jgi:hypothetical protein